MPIPTDVLGIPVVRVGDSGRFAASKSMTQTGTARNLVDGQRLGPMEPFHWQQLTAFILAGTEVAWTKKLRVAKLRDFLELKSGNDW